VAVYDKRNGETIYTNPLNADEDSIANNVNIGYLKSQLIFTYMDRMVRTAIFDSYSMAVEKGQFAVESIENGLRYRYHIGDLPEHKTGIVPIYITEDLLEELAERLGDRGTAFSRIYVSSSIAPNALEINQVVMNNTLALSRWQDDLTAIGWTEADFEEAMEEFGGLGEAAIPISFEVALDYRLEGDSLVVSVPASEIKSHGGGMIFNIQVLRYMGAAHSSESGYFVVPNAAGALINFNNGKQNYPIYQQSVYDIDPLLIMTTVLENAESVKLPLFGICRENSTILATIEDGATLSSISAVVSGTFNEYNYAYNTFGLSSADNLFMFGASATDTYVREPDIYDVNLTMRFSFLTEENKGYVGLANYYRDKLIKAGKLTRMSEIASAERPLDIPFYYDVIGGVKETNHFLGKQYLRVFPMTTFAEAGKMHEELSALGINYQVMNFQGWFNEGYYHDTADRIRLVRKLGSKKEFEALSAMIEGNGGRFYADANLQKASFADNSFNYNAVGIRYYGLGFVAGRGQTNPVTYWAFSHNGYPELMYNFISPKFLPRYVEKFTDKIDNYDIGGISLRDMTNNIYSDKKRTNFINREEALDVVMAQFDLLNTTGKNLMGNAAFDYTFPYLRDIINAPTNPNQYFIIDQDIPLYEMIIHGSINYSGTLLNFNNDEDKTGVVLNLIEYGASPHYVFTWEAANKMKYTGLNHYYNTTFEVWKHEANDIYRQVNEALRHVSGALMINHQIYGDLRMITYSNGVTIYVNYSDEPISIGDALVVEARSFSIWRT
jgi:hypothetical protein